MIRIIPIAMACLFVLASCERHPDTRDETWVHPVFGLEFGSSYDDLLAQGAIERLSEEYRSFDQFELATMNPVLSEKAGLSDVGLYFEKSRRCLYAGEGWVSFKAEDERNKRVHSFELMFTGRYGKPEKKILNGSLAKNQAGSLKRLFSSLKSSLRWNVPSEQKRLADLEFIEISVYDFAATAESAAEYKIHVNVQGRCPDINDDND